MRDLEVKMPYISCDEAWCDYPEHCQSDHWIPPMTLDEAIRHAEEKGKGCDNCAEEHRQLAEWLKELKERREREA
jgi:hypothetical protein